MNFAINEIELLKFEESY